jgi:hypothetical protein
MGKIRKSFWIVLLITAMLLTLAASPVAASNQKLMESNDNGKIFVYIFKDNFWQPAGSLSFDKYLRQKELNLDNFPTDSRLKVKLVKKGGGSAHLDAVFLGEAAPLKVNGEEGLNLAG